MFKIYKYPVEINDFFTIELPEGAQVLRVDEQHNNRVYLWALVDPDAPKRERVFRFAGTGHEIDDDKYLDYINTFFMRDKSLVWHIFEVLK